MRELAGILEGYCEYLTVKYAVIYNPDTMLYWGETNKPKTLQSILKQAGPSVKAITGYTESFRLRVSRYQRIRRVHR